MRQPGPPELGGECRVHRRGVTHDQTREQPGRPGGQSAGRGVGEAAAEGTGGALHGPRATDGLRRCPRRQHRPHVVPGLGGPHGGAQPHRLPGEQAGPVLGRPEQQHRVTAQGSPAHLADAGPHQHPGHSGAGQQPRVVVQLEHDRDGGLLLGRRGQRGDRPGVPADRCGGAGERDRGEAAQQDGGDRGPPHGARPPGAGQHRRAAQCPHRGRGQQQPHRRVRGHQRQQPDRPGGRHQPQVQPRPGLLGAPAAHRGPGWGHVRPARARPARRRSPGRCR